MAKKDKTTKTGPIVAERLKSFVERAERLMEERNAIQGGSKDVFHEAKGAGYDVKTMRKLIQVRAMDANDRAEQEALLDTYMHALGMDTSASVILPTEGALVDRAAKIITEVDRCVALVRAGKLPKIADIQDLVGCSAGKASKLRALVADKISRSNAATVKNENENPPHDPETGEVNPLRAEAEKLFAGCNVTAEIDARPGSLLDRVGTELEKAFPGQVARNATIDDDDMPPVPDFLRRVPA